MDWIGSHIAKRLKSPHPWLIIAMPALCTISKYSEQLGISAETSPFFITGLTRHTIGRTLYLITIAYAGLFAGAITGLFTYLAAMSLILPRAILTSPCPTYAIYETALVAILGVVFCLYLRA